MVYDFIQLFSKGRHCVLFRPVKISKSLCAFVDFIINASLKEPKRWFRYMQLTVDTVPRFLGAIQAGEALSFTPLCFQCK